MDVVFSWDWRYNSSQLYLIEVKGYSFIEVVETITGKQVVVAPKPIKQDNKYYERPLLLYRFSSL